MAALGFGPDQISLFTQLQRLERKNEGSDTIKLLGIFGYLCELKPAVRAIYSEIVTLVIILLVIPAANATRERKFSALLQYPHHPPSED